MGSWTLKQVEFLIEHRIQERTDLEFKRSLPQEQDDEDIPRVIAAMANSAGGTIVYGLEEDAQGRAIGPTSSLVPLEGASERVAEVVRTKIDEPPSVETSVVPENAGKGARGYLVVEVSQSDRRPHFVGGVAWGRAEQLVYKLKRQELALLFAKSHGFTNETGLSQRLRKPAQITADIHRAGDGRVLMFKNIGEQPAYRVRWLHLEGGGPRIQATNDPFPLENMPPLTAYPVHGIFPPASLPAKIEVSWMDEDGAPREVFLVVT